MSPFIMQSFKKIVGADFEKTDKVDFRHIHTYIHTYIHTDIHTDIHTYGGYLIGPSPAGGPKDGFLLFEIYRTHLLRFYMPHQTNCAYK